MQIAIVGGTGFAGSHTARALLDAGHEVVLISRGPRGHVSRRPRPGVRSVHLDITADAKTAGGGGMNEALAGCDVVINASGITMERGRQTFRAVHRRGTANVVAAAAGAGVKHLIHLSTIGAAADPGNAFLDSKWAAEQEVRAGSVPFTILRSSTLVGPGDTYFTGLTRAIRLSRAVAPIMGTGTTPLQPLDVTDFARVVLATVERGPSRSVIEVGGPDVLTLDQVVNTIKQITGLRRIDVHIPIKAALPGVAVMEKLSRHPGMTRTQLQLLERNRTTRTDSISSRFGFEPRRFAEAAAYLNDH